MHYDYWYGYRKRDADAVTVTFYPNEGVWRGNLWRKGEAIADFWSDDSVKIERAFPGIFGK